MRTELPIVSFLCTGLLVLLSPVWLHTRNAAVISLAAWLFCCSLIHGINALLWSGNRAIHVPAWCDIVTRVLLASQLALPGCALALARRLRRCTIGQEGSQKAYLFMQDLTFTLILPVLYIILHVIVQPHRFDIVQDFGCFASIDTSTVSIIIIWIPPLVICITTIGFALLAIRARLDSGLVFFSHMSDSPHSSIFAFLRPLITSLLMTFVSFSITIFSVYARVTFIGGIKEWTIDTWSGVHAYITEIFIVPPTARLDLVRTEVEWWIVPAYSFVLILITLTGFVYPTGCDSWRGYKVLSHWFRLTIPRQQLPGGLPRISKDFRGQVLRSAPPSPILIGAAKDTSGDIWRPSAPPRAKLAPLVIPERSVSAFELSVSPDDPFIKSTLDYIGSPTGREALALPHLSIPVPPMPRPPAQYKVVAPPPSHSPPSVTASPPRRTPSPPKAPRPDSLLSAPWPRPPSTIVLPESPRTPSPKSTAKISIQPPSPTPSTDGHIQPSPRPRPPSVMSATPSFSSSTITYGSFFDDSETRDTPFQEHLADLALGPERAIPKHLRKVRSRDLLPRTLSVSSKRRPHGSDGLSGGIYMTVVKETV
ncbi:STE3-domain-containing protein [Ganoderma leucocontextum]|nr:STE3-domain-containing protein [Ganoderma leucocontextum]